MAVSGRNSATRIAAEWHVAGHLTASDIIRYVEGELLPGEGLGRGVGTVEAHLHTCHFCRTKVESGVLLRQQWTDENLLAAGRALLHGHRPALWNALAKRSVPWRRGLVPALTFFRPELKPVCEPGSVSNTRDAYVGDDFAFTVSVCQSGYTGAYLFALMSSDYPAHQLRVLAASEGQRLAQGRVCLHGTLPLKVEEPQGVQVFHGLVVEYGPDTPQFPVKGASDEESLDSFLSGLLVLPPDRLVCVFDAALRVHGPRGDH